MMKDNAFLFGMRLPAGKWLNKKAFQIRNLEGFFVGDPAGIRTQDHYIKSVMLYQLSYGIKFAKCLNKWRICYKELVWKEKAFNQAFSFGDPAGIRTQDHYIKSVMLYQLSYGIIFL